MAVQLPAWLTKRTILILLAMSSVVIGAGVGILPTLIDDQAPTESATGTPAPPTVSATPPTETATESPSTDDGAGGADTPTSTPPGTPTESPTNQSVDGRLDLEASDPPDVVTRDGSVAGVRGDLSGTVSWNGSVDTVVLVVSTYSPDGGWDERRRVRYSPDDQSVSIETMLEIPGMLYVSGDRAAHFANPYNGSQVLRRGYVAATAIFYESGREVGRASDIAAYEFQVKNVGETDITLRKTVDVTVSSSTGSADAVAPGMTGREGWSVENVGDTDGRVRVFVRNVTGQENGFTEAESTVDGDQSSELLDVLEVRVYLADEDGRTYLAGSETEYVDFTTLTQARIGTFGLPAGRSGALVLEWRIPETVGNEIMTDSVTYDLEVEFVTDGE